MLYLTPRQRRDKIHRDAMRHEKPDEMKRIAEHRGAVTVDGSKLERWQLAVGNSHTRNYSLDPRQWTVVGSDYSHYQYATEELLKEALRNGHARGKVVPPASLLPA